MQTSISTPEQKFPLCVQKKKGGQIANIVFTYMLSVSATVTVTGMHFHNNNYHEKTNTCLPPHCSEYLIMCFYRCVFPTYTICNFFFYSAIVQIDKFYLHYKPVMHLLGEAECVGGKHMQEKQIDALRKRAKERMQTALDL